MKKMEWTRDTLSNWPGSEYVQQKERAGWRLSAIEWQREAEANAARSRLADARIGEEIPLRALASRATACIWKRILPKWKS